MPNSRTALYRLFAANGVLLYVGITGNPAARFRQHSRDKDWWPSVDESQTLIEWFDDRVLAEAAEVAAIAEGCPVHNRNSGGGGREPYVPSDGVRVEIDVAVELDRRRQAVGGRQQRAKAKRHEPGGVAAAIRVEMEACDIDLALIKAVSRLIEELDVPVLHLAARFGTSRKQVYRLSGKWMP